MSAFPLPFLLSSCLLLCSCLFETELRPANPRTDFDLSLLEGAPNPLAGRYPFDNGKSLVGLQFAYTSMQYARQADSNIEAFREAAGRYPALAGAYFDLTSRPEHVNAFLGAVAAKGCIPYVTLDPKDYDGQDKEIQKSFLAMIERGEFDPALIELARVFRDFSRPVLFRFAHEMNGDWYPYGGGGDADGDKVPDGPGAYIRAWRHAHDLFAREGAANLLWVFCPNAEDFPPRAWNRPFQYHPGSEYVDLIFVDAYEHHDKRTQSLEEAMDYFYNQLGFFLQASRAAGDSALRPFGLGEFGTNRMQGAAKTDWYEESLGYLAGDARVKFHILYNGRNGKEDFTITGLGARIKAAFDRVRFQFRLFAPSPA